MWNIRVSQMYSPTTHYLSKVRKSQPEAIWCVKIVGVPYPFTADFQKQSKKKDVIIDYFAFTKCNIYFINLVLLRKPTSFMWW